MAGSGVGNSGSGGGIGALFAATHLSVKCFWIEEGMMMIWSVWR